MKWTSIWKAEEGSTLVLTALGMVVIVAFAGLAIDVGNMRYTKRHLQSAADAAAIAGALEISSCAGTSDCAAIQSAAQTSLAENGFTGSTVLTNCSGAAGTQLTIMVNNPPCSQGASDPNSGKTGYVEVVASQTLKTHFGAMVGFSNVPLSVRAEAKRTPNPNCIYALDPTGGNAITADLLAVLNSPCGIVDESSAWNALSCNLIASISASQIQVTGGSEGFLCLLPNTVPKTGVPVPSPADPFAATVPKPPIPACGTGSGSTYHGYTAGPLSAVPLTLTVLNGPVTLYPDQAYCGGILIAAGANVTFMPGTYVIKSGGLLGLVGGLSISVLSNVSGNGVTFYNYGPIGAIAMVASAINLGGSVHLVAPTSGPYACMLFMQDPGNTTGAVILGSASWNTVLEGAYYFPNANVLYAASMPVNYNILVAKDIEYVATYATVSLTSSFSNDYSSVPNGCPMAGGGSVMVQ